jgi:hypothetical protein
VAVLVLVTLLGSRLEHPRLTDPLLWAPALAMIALVLVGPMLMRRGRRRAEASR